VPSSVLLAFLVGGGLLALLPALVHTYDVAELAEVERRSPTARLLSRARARSRVAAEPVAPVASAAAPAASAPSVAQPARKRSRRELHHWMVQRRRRVLFTLATLVVAQVSGIALVSPWFWVGLGTSGALMLGYVLRLRAEVLAEHRAAVRARLRRRRAVLLARRSTLAAGATREVESLVRVWLSAAPHTRPVPPAEVVTALAAAGRGVAQLSGGGWAHHAIPVVPVVRPRPRPARPAAPAAQREVPSAGRQPLRKAANS